MNNLLEKGIYFHYHSYKFKRYYVHIFNKKKRILHILIAASLYNTVLICYKAMERPFIGSCRPIPD